ncbi:glycosyltransferase family 4 protein [Aureimonas fodinaquatilis]|uniref:Glycosyltransferase family 4 protein n=1 Tax=Aureimonas fodinaquatilis TaxID=2565783 RepID=A0A5B0DWN6_9HYPH|nr:glycosyltransferase family 4 protein [Aureimonas fodinaquatilis]KAA0970778.1 glycosyltransferase family 4 protein [Aureimonas fodinaquatilis]
MISGHFFKLLRSVKPLVTAQVPVPTREPEADVSARKKPLALCIVSNPGTHDSRVLKQAASLVTGGYDVLVYARSASDVPDREVVDGIRFERLPMFDFDPPTTTSLRERAFELFGEEACGLRSLYMRVIGLKLSAEQLERALPAFKRRIKNCPSGTPERDAASEAFQRKRSEWQTAYQLYDSERRAAFPQLKFYLFTLNLMTYGLREKPSIIHSHDLYPLAIATCWAEENSAAVVFDAHELETARMPQLSDENASFVDRIERHLLKKTDGLITVSDGIARIYAGKFTNGTPLVIHNAPDLRQKNHDGPDIRSLAGIHPHTPLIAYTGNVGREGRGLHLVTEALRSLPEYHLAILGPRHAANDAWLMEKAAEHGVAERVHLLAPVAPHAVVMATRTADIGICPIQDASLSYRLSMPNKLFEMALSGIPLCVSDLPEMKRFVERNRLGVSMDQTDPSAIAAAIEHVYHNRAAYTPDAVAGASLMKNYSWAAQEKKLLRGYRAFKLNSLNN